MEAFWIKLILAILGGSGLMSIPGLLLQRHWLKKDQAAKREDETMNEIKAEIAEIREDQGKIIRNQRVITVDRVKYLGRKFILAEEISLEDKQDLKIMYDSYKELGGNGDLETIMEEVHDLPIK